MRLKKRFFPVLAVVIVILLILIIFSSQLSDLLKTKKSSPPDAVFLIIVDALRADRLSCYGYKSHMTRHIDSLASAGVMFTRAQSAGSWTLPGVGSIMTSSYPTQLGFIERPAEPDMSFKRRERRKQVNYILPSFKPTIAEILGDAGFSTAAFINQPLFNPRSGFQNGFIDYYYPVETGIIERFESKSTFHRQKWSSQKDAFFNDRALVQEFEKWLKHHSKEKLFIWLHLFTPHRPYLPLKGFRPEISAKTSPRERQSALYDGEILMSDKLIGKVLATIKQYVGLKRSLIVFAADHGEEFWEHGSYDHGHSLHRELIHVPLIIVSPLFPAGSTVNRYVRTLDILPTILDHTGIQAPESNQFAGTSLNPVVFKEGADLPVYSEGKLYGNTERSLIEDGYKLIYDEHLGQWKLYDIRTDEGETIDLSDKLPKQTEMMHRKIARLHIRFKKEFLMLREKFPKSQTKSNLNRQRALKALEALGYITSSNE
jgi:arylsulfatase A-like enzyme